LDYDKRYDIGLKKAASLEAAFLVIDIKADNKMEQYPGC